MKLIFNSVCILMEPPGLGDDTRPPLRVNEAASRTRPTPSPRPASINESNAPLGASDPRDVFKD